MQNYISTLVTHQSTLLNVISYTDINSSLFLNASISCVRCIQYLSDILYVYTKQFFMCPVDDPTWPSETWGMKLGFNVGNIRNRGIH